MAVTSKMNGLSSEPVTVEDVSVYEISHRGQTNSNLKCKEVWW
jgi:hypothetical protein